MRASTAPTTRTPGNAYEIFILVLTLLSLVVMVLLFLPLSASTHEVLRVYDNLICLVFLADFVYNLTGSKPRREYFIRRRGWLDLLGSIPSFGFLQVTAIFRLARLSRLARIVRILSGQKKKELVRDVVHNRSQYALFITLLLVMIVLTTSSVLVLQFESASPDANIKSGGDALWWSFVTITTVGYGDRFPVTPMGRMTAIGVMFAGIGVIGALASILASMLVSPAPELEAALAEDEPPAVDPPAVEDQLSALSATLDRTVADLDAARQELAALRAIRPPPPATRPPPPAPG